jgi:hypothetical protein
VDEVLRGQGIDPVVARLHHARLVTAARSALDPGTALLEPVAAFRVLPIKSAEHTAVRLHGGLSITGRRPVRDLRDACAVLIGACSIGDALERASAAAMEDDPALGFALDGLGNAALFALASRICAAGEAHASARGWHSTALAGPGAPGWPLDSGQRELLAALDGGASRIEVEESGRLVPAKSLSVVLAIGPSLASRRGVCDACSMQRRCSWRHTRSETSGFLAPARSGTSGSRLPAPAESGRVRRTRPV